MDAAREPRRNPHDARLLIVTQTGVMRHSTRDALLDLLHAGDVVVANDAMTLPASLGGMHEASGTTIELRLVGTRRSDLRDLRRCVALVFGEGDFHVRTEDRARPPQLAPGDRLLVGPLRATVVRTMNHPRLIEVAFHGSARHVWTGIATHGRPIQYAYIDDPLALWDVWTPVAGAPLAFEAPSAGFLLDWRFVAHLRERNVAFVTLTHAAGISSTGDAELDRRLPFDEPYFIPPGTARAIHAARARSGRVVAIGTTVVRALEHAASIGGELKTGPGLATQRIGAATRLRIVDALVSGTHEPGSSHYELLRAFAPESVLQDMSTALEQHGYRTHEFGDFVLIERARLFVLAGRPASSREVRQPPRDLVSATVA